MHFIRPSKLGPGWTAALMVATCVSLPAIEPERDANLGAAKDKTREMVQRATRFLWSKQSPDGAWRSETYGLLKSGQSLTPFVLLALSEVPPEIATIPDGAIEGNQTISGGAMPSCHGRVDTRGPEYCRL